MYVFYLRYDASFQQLKKALTNSEKLKHTYSNYIDKPTVEYLTLILKSIL